LLKLEFTSVFELASDRHYSLVILSLKKGRNVLGPQEPPSDLPGRLLLWPLRQDARWLPAETTRRYQLVFTSEDASSISPNDRDDAQIRLRGLVRGERHASEDKRARPHVLVEVAHRQCIGLTLKIMLVGPW
jgi:hypothetical protein